MLRQKNIWLKNVLSSLIAALEHKNIGVFLTSLLGHGGLSSVHMIAVPGLHLIVQNKSNIVVVGHMSQ